MLITSADAGEHEEHLPTVFQGLIEHGIIINPDKCELGVPQLNFLNFATTLHPLNDLLPSTETKIQELNWNTNAIKAFQIIKDTLANATFLVHPKSNALTCIMTGATTAYWVSLATDIVFLEEVETI